MLLLVLARVSPKDSTTAKLIYSLLKRGRNQDRNEQFITIAVSGHLFV